MDVHPYVTLSDSYQSFSIEIDMASCFPATRRQDVADMGAAYDGSFGVDSEDLLNVPDISFGSFQLFPDQATYGPVDPNLSGIEAVIAQGSEWIKRHARTSAA
jgi:mannan endo-1,4-beta-mannosidase